MNLLLNPWVWVAVAVAWLLSLAGAGYWAHGVGVDSERVIWQARELRAQQVANTKYRELDSRYRSMERVGAEHLAAVSAAYEERLNDAQDRTQHLAAAARAGDLRLRDPGARTEHACGGDASPAAADPGQRDGEAGAELSAAAAGFLLELTGEADQRVEQLTACQASLDALVEFFNKNNNKKE